MKRSTSWPVVARRRGVLKVAAAMALFATGLVFSEHLVASFGAFTLFAVELSTSTLVLWTALVFAGWSPPAPATTLRLSLPGLLQPGLACVLSLTALRWMPPEMLSLLWSAQSLFIWFWSRLFLGEAVPGSLRALGASAVLGVALAILPDADLMQDNPHFFLGCGCALLAVTAGCCYLVLAKRHLHQHAALPLTALHQLAGLLLVVLVRFLIPGVDRAPVHYASLDYLSAILAGLCVFGIPFWLLLRGVRLIGYTLTAQLLPLAPLLTMILGSLLLHRAFSPRRLVGVAVTLVSAFGMAFLATRHRSPPRRSQEGPGGA